MSFFSSHFEQTGKGTVMIFPPGETNVVSKQSTLEPHVSHRTEDACAERAADD